MAAITKIKKDGFFKKTRNGKRVWTDRSKASLAGAGAFTLFTPLGGQLFSGLTGQAAENTGQIIGGTTQGALSGVLNTPILSSSLSSLSVLVVMVLAFTMMQR